MLAAAFFFACMNALVKHLEARYAATEIVFFRCAFALLPILVAVARASGWRVAAGWKSLRTSRLKGHVFRTVAGTISMILFVYALDLLPLASTSALFFSGPLFVVLFSVLFLKEAVGWSRWSAVVVGFVGVLVMLHPDQGHTNGLGAVLALGSAVFYALAMIGVRALGPTEASVTTAFYFMFLSVLMLAPTLPFVWRTPVDGADWLLFAATGLVGAAGQLTMTRAYQCAPASLVSPFNYAGLLWATLFGFVVWDEKPGLSIFLGGALVIAAGVYLACREAKRQKTA